MIFDINKWNVFFTKCFLIVLLSILCLCNGIVETLAIESAETPNFHRNHVISDEQAHAIMIDGSPEEVSQLLETGYDVNKIYLCNTLLNSAIKSAGRGQNVAEHPEYAIEKIKILIDAGADVNNDPCPGKASDALAWALTLPFQVQILEMDANKGLDEKIKTGTEYCYIPDIVSKPCKDITSEERQGIRQYLHKTFGDANKMLMPYFMDIIKLLVDKGADINKAGIHGQAPLHHAASIPQDVTTEPVRYLVQKGADVNARDIYGQTPLFFAYGNGNNEVVELLINSGADISVRNSSGVTYDKVKGSLKRDIMKDDGSIDTEGSF